MYNYYGRKQSPAHNNISVPNQQKYSAPVTDFGAKPFIVDINRAALHNNTFRTALWTGNHLQTTLMEIPVGEDVGLEVHPDVDQYLRIEQGMGLVQMGDSKNNLTLSQPAFDNFAIFVPAGTWHNIVNAGNQPLKISAVYAPPNHPHGTVHETKKIAEAMEPSYDIPNETFGEKPYGYYGH